MSLFTELKRRSVFRVALFYVVSAWVIVQVAETVLPVFEVPDGFLRGIIVLLAIGFVPALIFAWAFELTPDGLKLDRDVRQTPSALPAQSARMNWATVILALVAIGLFAFGRWVPESRSTIAQQGPLGVMTQPLTEQLTSDPAEPPAWPALQPLVLPFESSIAVLAFENMSPDPDNAFFAEGISEEILNVLASIDALRVASRTSSFSLSGNDTPIREIAQRLGVGHVVEGSVRKAGNRVRISAQLIDAVNDANLWSDIYDRELVDIFAIQEEIARAIAGALSEKLGLQAMPLSAQSIQVEAPTDDLVAYELFLRGRRTFYQRGDTIDGAIADLRAAVGRDPDFGPAWSVLAAAYLVAPGYPTALSQEDALAGVRQALDKAIALVPDDPLAVAVDGQIQSRFNRDRVGGLVQAGRAAELARQDSTPRLWHAVDLLYSGYVREAEAMARAAWTMDPVVGINNGVLAATLLALGNLTEAREYARYAAENGWPHALPLIAREEVAAGSREAALNTMEMFWKAQGLPDDGVAWIRGIISLASRSVNDSEAEIEYRAGMAELSPQQREHVDYLAALLTGDPESFFPAIPPVDEAGDSSRWLRAVWQPNQRELRESPILFEIAERIGLLELWTTRGFPPGCVAVGGPEGRHLDCAAFP